MRSVCLLGVKAELGAGTRGASLGFDAVKIASLSKNKSFFQQYPYQEIAISNDALFHTSPHIFAKNIDEILKNQITICEQVHLCLKKNHFPFIISGDHSSASATIAGIKKTFPDKTLGVIWIDAHADLHSPYTTPSGNMHGMPVAIALAEDNITEKINEVPPITALYWEKLKNLGVKGAKFSPNHLVYVSVRDTEPQEEAFIAKNKIRNYTVEEIRRRSVEVVVREILEEKLADCDLIYISFDVDSMDSSISVGTGTPVAGGLSVTEAKEINALLVQDIRVCAWEMVEINPLLDTKGNKMGEVAFEVMESTLQSSKKTKSYEKSEITSLSI
ncbi:arginase [Raineya orbicola]|jgi:arginase|uniref:Arginase n=1 Tax=Raineya orbicola TaxID=2016530 RepID=A0A2N3I8B1_9BACT|nr:arginase [Raineya orbicola]PKQ66547.1 Arginase/agmatinase/formimionoglutamate hydrolase arginase family [Raineya orbicola]